MPVEIVTTTTTADGIKLHGALHAATIAPTLDCDAALLLHGTGSNFYSSSLWQGLIPRLTEAGLAVLAVNTRGHDLVTPTYAGGKRRLIGAAYEMVDECRLDVAAWLDSLAERGLSRIALVGHSMGGLKGVYSQACAAHPQVTRLIGISPPRLAYGVFRNSPQGELFLHDLARAEALLSAGKGETLIEVTFPIPYTITAAGYVDKYGVDERYDLLKHAPKVAVPQLFTFGQLELAGPAFRGVPEQLEAFAGQGMPLGVEVIAGADHVYSGCHGELAARILRWLRKGATK